MISNKEEYYKSIRAAHADSPNKYWYRPQEEDRQYSSWEKKYHYNYTYRNISISFSDDNVSRLRSKVFFGLPVIKVCCWFMVLYMRVLRLSI